MCDGFEEFLGAVGHAETLRGRPGRKLGLGELGPSGDQVEELKLERGEEYGDVYSIGERMLVVEVAGVDLQDLFVCFGGIGGELVD